MDVQVNLPGRWRAALVLLIPALLGFQVVLFSAFGTLLMLGAAFAAAVSTGYARKDAVGVAVGCSVLVLGGGTLELQHPAAAVIAYACAASVAIRPSGGRAIGARVAVVSVLLLLAGNLRSMGEVHAWGRVHGWWVLFFVPPLVAGVDALAGGGPAPESRPRARTGLTYVSAGGFAVVLLPWILGDGGGFWWGRLGVICLALAAAAFGAARSLRSVRTDPVRSVGTIVLAVVPIVILGWIVFVLLAATLGNGFQIGN